MKIMRTLVLLTSSMMLCSCAAREINLENDLNESEVKKRVPYDLKKCALTGLGVGVVLGLLFASSAQEDCSNKAEDADDWCGTGDGIGEAVALTMPLIGLITFPLVCGLSNSSVE
jgi:hypothetical protein